MLRVILLHQVELSHTIPLHFTQYVLTFQKQLVDFDSELVVLALAIMYIDVVFFGHLLAVLD